MAEETRGRRPLWRDHTELRKAVDKYFEECAKTDVFPDYAGMLLSLRIDEEDADAMMADGAPKAEEYRRIFKAALLRRKSWLARHMVLDAKKSSGCMNALKQPENGSYMDRPNRDSSKTIVVKMEGLTKGEDSFK